MASRLEGYLHELRERLDGLPGSEVDEILQELRSHVRDSVRGGDEQDGQVADVLARFGSAEQLAALYLRDRVLAPAGRSRSPWVLLVSLFRWATLSAAGVCALLGLLTGYALSLSFLLGALRKPFAPDRVGLWRVGDDLSLRLGFGAAAPGEELLGFWIVPIGLLAGTMGVWLTTWAGRAGIGALRRPPVPPRP